MDNKIKAALISISRIDDPLEHREYNYWHRHDHMAEVWARPGVAYAQRFVAPPALLKLRGQQAGPLAGVNYFTLYLLTEPLKEVLDMFAGRGSKELSAKGRLRLLKNRPSGGIFRLVKAYANPGVVVSPNAVPFLPHAGVFVGVTNLLDMSQKQRIDRWLDEVHIPDLLSVRHVTGCYWFEAWNEGHAPKNVAPAPPGWSVLVYFLDGDPQEMVLDMRWKAPQWQAAGRMLEGLGKAREVLLTSPFMPITGTRYDWFD